MEDAIRDRIRELDEREAEVDQRQASLDADIDIRTDKIEVRESALAELEAHLTQKEAELATYVGKAQTELQRREAVWWDKQLGREEADGEAVEVDAA
jgi:Skp family chaperone for outer membrane proteins